MSVPTTFAVERIVAAGAALDTAAEVGLLAHLRTEGPVGVTRIGAELGLDTDLSARLLDALVALDVVADAADGYSLEEPVEAVLDRMRQQYAALSHVLRGGRRPHRADSADEAAELYASITPLLGDAFREAAAELAAHLDVRLPDGPLRVLDVGAGAAPWSLALARRRPDASIVAVDLPDITDVTRRAAAAAGLADTVRVVEADVFEASLETLPGTPADVAVLGNFCHLFPADRVEQLLARLGDVLAEGGVVAIIDTLPTGAPEVAIYALGLALRTRTGGVHGRDDYVRWLAATGFDDPHVHRSTVVPGVVLLTAARLADAGS